MDSQDEKLMEEVVEQARSPRHSWLIACDANMEPYAFKESGWFHESSVYIKAPEGREGRFNMQTTGAGGEAVNMPAEVDNLFEAWSS